MKILHVYKDYHPVIGGIENHVKGLAEAQAAAGHDVSVLVADRGRRASRATLDGVEVIRVGRLATVLSTPISPMFPIALAGQSPDVVHLHYPYPLGELSQLVAGRGKPYVVTYHSDVVNPKQQGILRAYRPFLTRVLGRAGKIVVTSHRYLDSSATLRGLTSKCVVVPLGIEPSRFLSAAPRDASPNGPTVLFVGKHRYYKGVDVLLRAMSKVRGRLLIAGDGPMRDPWEALAAELSLSDRAIFLGEVADEDLPNLYKSADLFVLPSTMRAEAFGTVLLEAMAAGLPCIATELGTGTSYVVRDALTGLVVQPNDPAALVEAISRLAADADLRRKMGNAGQARVLEEFTHEGMVERIENIYRSILNPRLAARETVHP
jgi:rhamnosyl/mannosyltransferase